MSLEQTQPVEEAGRAEPEKSADAGRVIDTIDTDGVPEETFDESLLMRKLETHLRESLKSFFLREEVFEVLKRAQTVCGSVYSFIKGQIKAPKSKT